MASVWFKFFSVLIFSFFVKNECVIDYFQNNPIVGFGPATKDVDNFVLGPLPVSKPLGEVSGVAFDKDGKLLAFHRGDRVWDQNSFEKDAKLNSNLGKIKNSTIYIIEPLTGQVLEEHGDNEFYMPHGMSTDKEGNIYVTDVGSHQVFRLNTKYEKTLILGEELISGTDSKHFCQPTDVAVASNGDIFISDGYCNARIMKFDSYGNFINEFGTFPNNYPAAAGEFFIPHSLTLIEDLNMICVADRENERIQCFSAGLDQGHHRNTQFGMFITKAENIGRIFGIRESQHYLVGVTGKESDEIEPQVFAIDINNGKATTYAKGLDGHALAVNDYGDVFVAHMNPNQIIQLRLGEN